MQLSFEPNKWHSCDNHDWRTCTQGVNCYAYILNRPEYYWAVPGHGYVKAETQRYYKSYDAYFEGMSQAMFRRQFVNGAKGEGLIPVAEPEASKEYYMVALFFPEQTDSLDFHWYRQDDNGTWSHKNGWHAIANKTSDGKMIKDPRVIHDTDYPIFSGFFLAPRNGVKLTKKFPLVQ